MLFRRKKFEVGRFLTRARGFDPLEAQAYEELVSHYLAHGTRVTPKPFGLKLIVVSDTHGDLGFGNKFEEFFSGVAAYDLCLILGDLCPYELERVLTLVPKEKLLALRGNHDRPDLLDQFGIPNLNGKTVTHRGVTFAGIEGSFRYKKGEWPMYTHYESLLLASGMSKGADVLLTHDRAFLSAQYDHAHAGLAGITYYLFEHGIPLHIHGHLHKSYRKADPNGAVEQSVYGCEYIEI